VIAQKTPNESHTVVMPPAPALRRRRVPLRPSDLTERIMARLFVKVQTGRRAERACMLFDLPADVL
jgi:hypothetical protein